MKRFSVLVAVLAAFQFASLLSAEETQPPSKRSVNEILADYKAAVLPQPDEEKFNSDKAYRDQFLKDYMAAQAKRQQIGRELIESYPDDPAAIAIMPEVWVSQAAKDPEGTQAQIDRFIASAENQKNISQAKYIRTVIALRGKGDNATKLDAINQFLIDVPDMKNEGATLLLTYSQQLPPKDANTILKRVIDQYPGTPAATRAEGLQKLAEAEGKPFELEFTDAINGQKISTKDLKGKVIVVDFWATWCGPCVGEMPHMKKLYADYKDKGVEFIGVSLDQPEAQGGLKALKDFVAKNEIGWPQYYQGKGWGSEFSSGWGINSIPHVFVIDQDGKIVTTQGRGQLETLLPKLLAKQG